MRLFTPSVFLVSMSCVVIADDPGLEHLFDGRSLNGWEGDKQVFRIVDGAIVAGSLRTPIDRSEYLCTTESYSDFELTFEARIEGAQNSGVHFRSARVPDSSDVAGYQADIGYISAEAMKIVAPTTSVTEATPYPLWGSLLDEYRLFADRYPKPEKPYLLLKIAKKNEVESVLKPREWNRMKVRAKGAEIDIWLNGLKTISYIETAPVPVSGLICLQLHVGAPSRASYRTISLRNLNSTP